MDQVGQNGRGLTWRHLPEQKAIELCGAGVMSAAISLIHWKPSHIRQMSRNCRTLSVYAKRQLRENSAEPQEWPLGSTPILASEVALARPLVGNTEEEVVVSLARPSAPAGEAPPNRLPIQIRIPSKRLGAVAGALAECRGAAAAAGRARQRTAKRATAARRRAKDRDIEPSLLGEAAVGPIPTSAKS